MFPWSYLLAEDRRYRDLVREAERDRFAAEQRRLARQALSPRVRNNGVYRRTLAGLGVRFVRWGEVLQQRYGAVPPVDPLTQAR